MPQPQIDWQSRPRPLREFPENAQVRLRQLDFNRTIKVHLDDQVLYVKRIGLNQFLWSGSEFRASEPGAPEPGNRKLPQPD
jgi:hypothetical protein